MKISELGPDQLWTLRHRTARALDVIVGTRPLIDEDVRRHRQLLEKIGARLAEPDPRVERRQALASEAGRT